MDPYYDDAGKFRWRDKKLGFCALCKKADFNYNVGALGPSTRFCRQCIKKEGAMNLRKDANVALQRAMEVTGTAQKQMRDLAKKYEAKFGARLEWRLPKQ